MNILEEYIKSAPNPQHLVDIFKNEWSSKLPAIDGAELVSGNADLFTDGRITKLNEKCNIQGKNILELGPLEAAHTYMMHQMGAANITCIESNTRAFLKCLIVKELYQLLHTTFLLGDALEYMKHTESRFDICVASGILYHSTNPAEFIQQCCKTSDKVFIWTHYYDPSLVGNYPALNGKFSGSRIMENDGFSYTAHQFEYLQSLEWSGFCGGSSPHSLWIEKRTMLDLFAKYNFNKVDIFFDDQSHPFGPNICFLAEKSPS